MTLSIQNILDKLILLSDEKIIVNINKDKFRPVDILELRGDNSFIKKEFNLSPQFRIDETLKNILDYWRFKSHE